MLMRVLRSFGLALALVLAVSLGLSAQEIKLRLLSTTDIHTHLYDYDYYRDAADDSLGLARTATLIRKARAEAPNVLLFDSGDLIQGNPLGDYVARESGFKEGQTHPTHKAMAALNYDAATLGNHEFNYGLPFLEAVLKGTKIPYVTSNVFLASADKVNAKPLIQPFAVLDREFVDGTGAKQKVRVGVIGFVPPQIMTWDKANLEGKAFTIGIVEAAKRYVPQIKAAGADIVVAVVHSGLSSAPPQETDENAANHLTFVPDIDAVLAGHAHRVFPDRAFASVPGADIDKGTINGVPTVMAGFWGSHLGVVELTLKKGGKGWERTAGTASAWPIRRRDGSQWVSLAAPDPEILALVKAEHEGTLGYVRRPVAKTTDPITSYFALVQDDPSIQIVTRAQTDYVRKSLKDTPYAKLPILSAGAPFKAGGRGGPNYFTDVPAGDIAIKNVADLYLYPNTVRAVKVTGAGVREWLEMSAGQFNRIDPAVTTPQTLVNAAFPTYNFDVIDGVTYRIDLTQPPRYDMPGKVQNPNARRIVDLRFEGKPIDDAQEFVVATNNYRASGGGNFPGLDGKNVVFESPETSQEMLMEWLMEKKTIQAAVLPNWSFLAISAPVEVVFETSPAAQAYAKGNPKLQYLDTAANGFARFKIDLR